MNINYLLIVMGILLIIKIINGYKKGLVKELVSLISLIFLCIFIALVSNGLKNYLSGNFISVAVSVILLGIMSIVHHFLQVLLLPAKLITKLSIVHGIDKLLGIVFGVLETVFVLWTVYSLLVMMDMGMIGVYLRECIAENPILTWFYEHNQLMVWIQKLGVEFDLHFLDLQFLKNSLVSANCT